jgi:uncharacterized protein (TIGR03435 family)
MMVPLVTGIAFAQTSLPPAYTYEVVSIHKSDPAARNIHIGPGPQGGLQTTNTSPMTLLTFAYGVRDYQILNAPGWVSSEHFDVTFTPDKTEVAPDPGMPLKELQAYLSRGQQRMQAVLRDRFGLVLRTETRELPIYSLTSARNGNKLLPHEAGKPGPSISTNGRAQIKATGATLDMLAKQLSMQLGRPVRDETRLDGQYDFTLNWTPDPEPGSASESNPLGPSIFTAITDQLGLRLESTKGPVQVYVIEKIEQPGDN